MRENSVDILWCSVLLSFSGSVAIDNILLDFSQRTWGAGVNSFDNATAPKRQYNYCTQSNDRKDYADYGIKIHEQLRNVCQVNIWFAEQAEFYD